MTDVTILNLSQEIRKNNMDIIRLRRENAEYKFCATMLQKIETLCKEFRIAVMEIDLITEIGTMERSLMIEALLDAYTYELEKLKTECVMHKVSKKMISMLFNGLEK